MFQFLEAIFFLQIIIFSSFYFTPDIKHILLGYFPPPNLKTLDKRRYKTYSRKNILWSPPVAQPILPVDMFARHRWGHEDMFNGVSSIAGIH